MKKQNIKRFRIVWKLKDGQWDIFIIEKKVYLMWIFPYWRNHFMISDNSDEPGGEIMDRYFLKFSDAKKHLMDYIENPY